MRIEESNFNEGKMLIGVCNEAGTCAWGLWLAHGFLACFCRTAHGQHIDTPPPEGWPYGHRTEVLVNEAGQPTSLRGRARGAVIQIVVDRIDGSLAFGVNAAPPRRVPEGWPRGYEFVPAGSHESGSDESVPEEEPPAKVPFTFPQGAQLRPWARLFYRNDRVSFARAYL